MSVVKRNILANFGGSVWAGLMSFVFIPVYISIMGIEAYGLVGLFSTMMALFSLLDAGLSGTLKREIAHLSVHESRAQDMRDLLRTLEIPYLSAGILIGLAFVFLSPLIANHWLKPDKLSPQTVQLAIMIMGLVAAFQWPLGFYSGGLQGLQKQVLLNSIDIAVSTCRGVGAILVLLFISPTIEAFFIWQGLLTAVKTILLMFFLWHYLPKSAAPPRFRKDVFQRIWRFAAFVSGSTIMAAIITQMDKVILSRMLSLEVFGYYSLASVVALNIFRIVNPIASAVSPKLTNLVSLGEDQQLIRIYHKSAQLLSAVVFPVAAVVFFFSTEILLIWTQNLKIAENSSMLVSILVIGAALNGITAIPYGLQLAYGWPNLTFFLNLFSAIVCVPLIILLIKFFGPTGAAFIWIIFNGCNVFFAIPIMHKRLIPAEKWRWYKEDIGLPLIAAFFVAGFFKIVLPAYSNMIFLAIILTIISLITFSITMLATATTREWLLNKLFYSITT
ncbi:MAG: oligosaccharide flippase family protein [Pseudomonadota bacterium]